MTRETISALALLGCVALCACTPNAKWEDTTGKGRSDAERKADYAACYQKSGFRPDGTRTVSFNAAMDALDDCMQDHGWLSESAGRKRR
ncbi:MAG TPA: hypothetical protein VE987_07435 [Polyangiaceae bacterium]|nr:hypothetical protein [Polyangiaceae bacterium]